MAAKHPPDITGSMGYTEEDIQYFLYHLEKTGQFDIRRKDTSVSKTSTPKNVSLDAPTPYSGPYRFGTPTPERIVRQSQQFGPLSQFPPPVSSISFDKGVMATGMDTRPKVSSSLPPPPPTSLNLTDRTFAYGYGCDSFGRDKVPPPVPPKPAPRTNPPNFYGPNETGSFYSGRLDTRSNLKVPRLPQFSGEGGKEDVDFEVWRYDVSCLVKEGVYPQWLILESIRRSLKGRARSVLLHLGESACVRDIVSELEGIYGNVSSSERLKQQFYSAQQNDNESVAEYSLRLEHMLSHSNLQLSRSQREEMLCSRLWSGLRDHNLRNISRFKFESTRDYNVLRRELRQIEEDLSVSKSISTPVSSIPSSSSTLSSSHVPSLPASQCMSLVESKLLQQLQELTNQFKQVNTRVGAMEKELQSFRNASNGKGHSSWKSNRNQSQNQSSEQTPTSTPSSVPSSVPTSSASLNTKGSSSQGRR